MNCRIRECAFLFVSVIALCASATTNYVSLSGTHSPPYSSWATAATNIQSAVDAASPGDTVLVTNGVYNSGYAVTPGFTLTNRVCITNTITLRSVNGPADTVIEGAHASGGGTGTDAVRGVYMTAGTISGFTVINGSTDTATTSIQIYCGGGILLDGGGMVTNCTLSGNAGRSGGGVFCNSGGTVIRSTLTNNVAYIYGGGAYCSEAGSLDHCLLIDNMAYQRGGGVYMYVAGTLTYCTLSGNHANSYGGGVFFYNGGIVNNCTILDNSANGYGGGAHCQYGGTINNSLIAGNTSNSGAGSYYGTLNNCTLSDNRASSTGGGVFYGLLKNCIIYANTPNNTYSCNRYYCYESNPSFVNAAAGNYRLQTGSPCINAGYNGYVIGTTDCDGAPRIYNTTVDIGAYEYSVPVITVTDPAAATVTVGYDVDSYTVGGTHNGVVAGNMQWSNSNTGQSDTFPAATPWSVADIPLGFGNNTITVSGANWGGNPASDSVLIIRTMEHSGDSTVHYVSTDSPSPSWPYTNWVMAAHTIQDAVSTASHGDTVLVADGVYDSGGEVVSGNTISNRVVVKRDVTVRSVNGAAHTAIVGVNTGSGGIGAVRGVYMQAGTIEGFTIAGGGYRGTGAQGFDYYGGNVFLDGAGIVSGCIITNGTSYEGGGVCCYEGGTLNDCIITGNTGLDMGGGLYCYKGATLNNCLIYSNLSAFAGGGMVLAYDCEINNCIIYGNHSDSLAGGIHQYYGGKLRNSIVYGNTALSEYPNVRIAHSGAIYDHVCINPMPAAIEGTVTIIGCITNDPQFVGGDDFHLQSGSPCIDAGRNSLSPSAHGLDGLPRPLDGNADGSAVVDMGCYEFMNGAADSDGDGRTDGVESNSPLLNPVYDESGAISYGEGNVTNNPVAYNLYTPESIMDLNMGYMMIQTSNGWIRLNLQLEKCTNLTEGVWQPIGDPVQWQGPADPGKAFFRVRGGE